MNNSITTQDSTLLFVQQIDSLWRCLIVEVTSGQAPKIAETIEVDSEESLQDLIKLHEPNKTYSILSGAETVCRTTSLPDVEQEQMYEALRLQAEARLLGGTPSYRRVMAPLDSSIGETNRVGLIISWPERNEIDIPEYLKESNFIPETVALAALLDGIRPTEPMLIANPSDGAVSLAISHANGAAIRATRENVESRDSFIRGIINITKETAKIHNHSNAFIEGLIANLEQTLLTINSESTYVILPEVVTENASAALIGCQKDTHWWRTWGVLAGSAIAATGSLNSLTLLEYEAPEVNPTFSEKLTQRLSSQSFANKMIVAAMLVLVFGPAILSGVRLGLLKLMNPEIESRYSMRIESKQQQIVYKALEDTAWPMSKLLADINLFLTFFIYC